MQSTAYKKAFSDGIITGEELVTMGNIGPCELVKGRIMPMSPTGGKHGAIESNFVIQIGSFVKKHALVWVVDAKSRHVYAYRSVTDVQKFLPEDDLKVEDILPGFSVKVEDLFEA